MLDREGTITLDTRRQALTHVEAWYGLGRDCGVPWCLRWIRNCRFGNSGDRGCVHCTSAHGKRRAYLHRQEVTHLSFAKSLSARSSSALIYSAPSSFPPVRCPHRVPHGPCASEHVAKRPPHPDAAYESTYAGVAHHLVISTLVVAKSPAAKKEGPTAWRETRVSLSPESQ